MSYLNGAACSMNSSSDCWDDPDDFISTNLLFCFHLSFGFVCNNDYTNSSLGSCFFTTFLDYLLWTLVSLISSDYTCYLDSALIDSCVIYTVISWNSSLFSLSSSFIMLYSYSCLAEVVCFGSRFLVLYCLSFFSDLLRTVSYLRSLD